MALLQDLSQAELIAKIVAMQTANQRKLTLKVTAKKEDGTGTSGAISLYGLGRFPITLYASQWDRLLNEAEHIRAFMDANRNLLATKD